jgi:hypothetical protein
MGETERGCRKAVYIDIELPTALIDLLDHERRWIRTGMERRQLQGTIQT